MKKHSILLLLFLFLLQINCGSEQKNRNEVVVHILSDPEMLNPLNSQDATAVYITNHLFQRLLDIDFRTLELVPVLAESRPKIEKTSDGKMFFTYRIRDEAKWDNGSSITAEDVEFTLKALKNPLVNNPHSKPYYEFIEDIQLYPDDPLKFTIVYRSVYILAEAVSCDYPILPEYFYDSAGLLRNFTLKQIAAEAEKLKDDPAIKKFADGFNSEQRMRDPKYISGSGPYKFTEWKTGERVILQKKENWWGEKFVRKDSYGEKENCFFGAEPEKLIYQIIKGQTTALIALKAGNLDVMYSIKSKDFAEFPQSKKINENFNTFTPTMLGYTYIGVNTKSQNLSDKRTRQAIAYLTNADEMIHTIKYNYTQRVIGPVHPSKKNDYNSDIIPYNFNPEKAKKLLEEAGWKNTNNDETLDKMIDGRQTEFIIDFCINIDSDERKSIALMFQAEAKKTGIHVNIIPVDWSVYLSKIKKHEFDLMIGTTLTTAFPNDFKQTFHSESTVGEGSNFSNFTNAEADALIDSIRVELDENKRAIQYKKLQRILHDEVPMIFLWAPTERIAIHKRFVNAYPSVMRPGFWEAGFKLLSE